MEIVYKERSTHRKHIFLSWASCMDVQDMSGSGTCVRFIEFYCVRGREWTFGVHPSAFTLWMNRACAQRLLSNFWCIGASGSSNCATCVRCIELYRVWATQCLYPLDALRMRIKLAVNLLVYWSLKRAALSNRSQIAAARQSNRKIKCKSKPRADTANARGRYQGQDSTRLHDSWFHHK